MRLTSTEVARWVALHGPLLSTGADAASLPPPVAAAVVAMAILPALAYAVLGEQTRLGPYLAHGVVPAGWLVGIALVDVGLGPEAPVSTQRVLRHAISLLVYLIAVRLAEPAAPERPTRPAGDRLLRDDPTRRARLRAALLATTAGASVCATFLATVTVVGATPTERTFAVVIAGTLGLTLLLAALPSALRRERTAPGGSVSGFAWLALAAVLAAASSYVR